MATTYRKTAKGQVEIETRALRLPPRLRSVLILVDGRRTDAELFQLAPGSAGPESLQALADAGLIEVIGITADAAPAPARPAAAPPAPRPAAAPAAANPQQLGRKVARELIDLVGPAGETLAIKLESVRSADELEALAATAIRIVGDMRGRAAAEAFAQRIQGG